MSRSNLWGFVLAVVFVVGCYPKPELIKRYNSVEVTKSQNNNEARLGVFAFEPSDATTQPNIFNLGERAQAELVRSVRETDKDSKGNTQALLAIMGFPIVKPKEVSATIDRTRLKRRIVVSIENTSSGPADRLAAATIIIKSLTGGAKFLSWDKFVSQYQNIDLGTLKFTRTNEFALNVKASPPIANASIEGTAKSTMGVEENLAVKERVVSFTGSLNYQEARLFQEGAVGIDLTGNVVVDIEVEVPHTPGLSRVMTLSNLYDGTGKVSGDKVKLLTQDIKVPIASADIKADATLEYLLRKVTSGDGTINEGDDVVMLVKGVTPSQPFVLIPKEDLTYHSWWLIDSNRNVLHITKRPGGCGGTNAEPLRFKDYNSALTFLYWLSPTHRTIGDRQLCYQSAVPDQTAIDKLQVELAN